MYFKNDIEIKGQTVKAIQLLLTISNVHTPDPLSTATSKVIHLKQGETPNSLVPVQNADIELSFVMDNNTPPELLPYMLEISRGIRGLLKELYGYEFEGT